MRTNEFDQPVGDAVDAWQGALAPPRSAIEGQYCRIEPLDSERHTDGLLRSFADSFDGTLWTYMPVGPFSSSEEMRSWLEKLPSSEDPLFYAIISRKTGHAVGIASYCRIKPEFGVIEVGHIAYSPALQRTRAATEAMFLMMRRAFTDLGYRRYEWKCDSLNAASRAAAERLGFSFEGIFRQALVYKNRNRDTAWYAILDHEWPATERAFVQWLESSNFDENGQQRTKLAELLQKERG